MNTKDNSKRQQRISAILDNDLDQQEISGFMQDLKRDPETDAENIQRYQLIGDALRDDLNIVSFMNISAAVHRAVEQEPEYQTSAAKIESKKPFFEFSAWTKPLAGMAIAASVAMVTVVSFRTVEINSMDDSSQILAAASVKTKRSTIVPVNPAVASQVRLASTAESKTQLQTEQLNDYMMRHSNSAGQFTMQGMVPYVRAVNFDSNR